MPDPKLHTPREAAQVLGISYSTLKKWIHEKKLQTLQTAGGHHRIPASEVDKYLLCTGEPGGAEKRSNLRRVSGRNQLVAEVIDVKVDGLLAQVTLSIDGQRITSIVTADAVNELRLKKGQTVAALVKATNVMVIRP